PIASGKPYPIGLPEASLGICPGWGGTNLLPARIDPTNAIRRTAAGKPLMYDEAVTAGLFDRVAPNPDELLTTAKKWVAEQRELMGHPGGVPRRDGAPSRWIGRGRTKPAVMAAVAKMGEERVETDPARAVLEAVRAGLEDGWQA